MTMSHAAAVTLALLGLSACGDSTSTTAASSTSGVTTQPSATSPASATSSSQPSTSTQQTSTDSTPAASGTPTPVADPCALIPAATLLAEFHTDATKAHLNAEKTTVSGSPGCIFDLTGGVDVEVILTIGPASSIDTSGGGLTVAGHPAAYRQTEGGAAEIDVTVNATSAFTVSVNIGHGSSSADSEKPQALDLANVVAAVYR